ncbi:MAG: hypothetical protein JWP97_4050 [Labilithrix sp.]|nr:hypothetical protein [Labilithrix sp.]
MRRVTKEEAEADMAARGFARRGTNRCAMCMLVEGARSSPLRVHEDASTVMVLDRYAATRGNLLVILREHVERATELPLPTYLAVQRRVFEAQLTLEHVLGPRRVYTAILGSPAALPGAPDPPAMSFPHLHAHAIPVYDDGPSARPAAVFSWSAGVWLYDEGEAEEVAAALRAGWIDAG